MWGRNPFPRRFGGGTPVLVQAQNAMLDALRPALDVSIGTATYAETYAHAGFVMIMWRCNGRLANCRVPLKMMELLPDWEKACKLRPAPTQSLQDRRAALAARLLGFVGNAFSQIYDLVAQLAGPSFLGLAAVVSTQTSYEPGLNPGPPGLEWSSTRAIFAVQLAPVAVADAVLLDLVRRLQIELQIVAPAWNWLAVGTDEGGWTIGSATVGLTLL